MSQEHGIDQVPGEGRHTLPARMTEAELERTLVEADTFESAVRLLLDILADESAKPGLKLTALQRLGAATFQPVPFAPFHAEFLERLRQVAESPDKDLRLAALDRLSLVNDEVGQRLLRESLEGTRKPLVPAATAARFLARDEHGAWAPLFRELARAGAPRVREEALRALAADPESVDLLASVASDKSERVAVRELATMSLKVASPGRLATVARDLLLDEHENPRMRATAMSAITFSPEATEALDSHQFSAAIKRIKSGTGSRSLRASIDRFTESTASTSEP